MAAEAERDLADYEKWQDMQTTARKPNHELFEVRRVHLRAQNGCKAIVKSMRTGKEQDAWFASMSVRSGGVALVADPSSGWGPHSMRPGVLYVRPNQMVEYISGPARQGADRHKTRLQSHSAR